MPRWFSRLRRVVPQPWQPWAIIVSIFVALGIYYSVTTPLWEAPDEPAHFGNVWYIATHKQLPVPGTFYTWHQSPLYHIIAAAFISGVEMSTPQEWIRPNPRSPAITNSGEVNIALHSLQELAPYRDISLAAHIARWVNVFFGAITVTVTYILGRRMFPARPWIAVGAAGLVAFNPQFIFMNSVVQNDALLSAAFALTLLPALSIVQGDYRVRQFLGLGALTGVAILAKQSGIVLIGVAGAVILWAAWQTRGWKNLFV
ncbi:MAG: glycosyltransferase family 39 protein, partial [Anaerolineae bacterium]|nr:glycosyltransferase family 39 protein [Anaerolineae bacterium]